MNRTGYSLFVVYTESGEAIFSPLTRIEDPITQALTFVKKEYEGIDVTICCHKFFTPSGYNCIHINGVLHTDVMFKEHNTIREKFGNDIYHNFFD